MNQIFNYLGIVLTDDWKWYSEIQSYIGITKDDIQKLNKKETGKFASKQRYEHWIFIYCQSSYMAMNAG